MRTAWLFTSSFDARAGNTAPILALSAQARAQSCVHLCYRSPVLGSADKVAGFALGALLDGDRDASQVTDQIPRAFHDAVRTCLADVSGSADKRESLAVLIRKVRPTAHTHDALPQTERTRLEPAYRVRASKVQSARAIDPDLTAMLKRLAAQPSRVGSE